MLAEVRRGPFVESRHRGHVVQVDVSGKVERGVGDPDYVTSLRSAVKPFAVAALLEAGGAEQFHLTNAEIAVMAASHHGEDAHVRTIQAMLRRAGLSQSLLACGTEEAPVGQGSRQRGWRATARRPARSGTCARASTRAACCSADFPGGACPTTSEPEPPEPGGRGETPSPASSASDRRDLVTAVDNCGVLTYAFPMASIARAFALLADPAGGADASQASLVAPLTRIRDAMTAAPEMVGGTRDAS